MTFSNKMIATTLALATLAAEPVTSATLSLETEREAMVSHEEISARKLRGRDLTSSNICNSYDPSSGQDANFGTYWNHDSANPPCGCDPNSTFDTLYARYNDVGAYFGYLCTTGNCNNFDGYMYDYGIYHNNDSTNPPCGCDDPAYPNLVTRTRTTGSTQFGYVCAADTQTSQTTPSPTPSSNGQTNPPTPSPTPLLSNGLPVCNTYDPASNPNQKADFGLNWSNSTNPLCGCDPTSTFNTLYTHGPFSYNGQDGLFGFVCTTGNCPSYDGNGVYNYGIYSNNDSTNPPCGCNDPAFPTLVTKTTSSGGFGYVCEAAPAPTPSPTPIATANGTPSSNGQTTTLPMCNSGSNFGNFWGALDSANQCPEAMCQCGGSNPTVIRFDVDSWTSTPVALTPNASGAYCGFLCSA